MRSPTWSFLATKLRDSSSSTRLTKFGPVKKVIYKGRSCNNREAKVQRGRVCPMKLISCINEPSIFKAIV